MSRCGLTLPIGTVSWMGEKMTKIGVMMYVRANNGRMARILNRSKGQLDSRTVREALRYIVPFLAAGLSRPPHLP